MQAAEQPQLLKERVLVFAGENWHHGVIGIAASRLEEQFGKPTILITIEGDQARGSMRSFGEFSAFRCLHAAVICCPGTAVTPAQAVFLCRQTTWNCSERQCSTMQKRHIPPCRC